MCTCIALHGTRELSHHPEDCFHKEEKIMSESSFSVILPCLLIKSM